MNKEKAKEKIKRLISKYENLSIEQRKKYNEQQTKDHFIRPLFEALGWDFENDVWPETDVSGKRVDYAFKLDGTTRFYIEAKALSVNLEEDRWAEQAIGYAWHKNVPWVILTDFETIKVFNTEWDEPNIQSCRFIELNYKDYLVSEKIWWLSKTDFQSGILDKVALEYGRKPKKVIDIQLAEDLVRWREEMLKELAGYNSKIEKHKIVIYVQTILNRLIFIRKLEDSKIEEPILLPAVRNWKEKKTIKANLLLKSLNKIFHQIAKDYDSGLFEEGPCDYLGEKLEADDNLFADIIEELYHSKSGARYNFADIPADIYGSIYEQYLSEVQKDGEEKKSGKRKSQGIYYTPRYIVDYIVKNTIGELMRTETTEKIKNLKILDPACGSGSFLIAAYQQILEYYQKEKDKKLAKAGKMAKGFAERKGNELSPVEKERILLKHIYGMDLDEEAVELARLNLLMKMVGKRMKLPNLDSNIQNGNSLISGNDVELKKYFGDNWKDKKPFNWQDKFPFCHSHESGNSGFDVIIGNPPYIDVRKINDDEKKYLFDVFTCTENRTNTFSIFIEKSLLLLKEGGYLSFIIPNTILSHSSYKKLREKILNECLIISIFDLGKDVFKDATVDTVVLVLKKNKNATENRSNNVKVIKKNEDKLENLNFKQNLYNINEDKKFLTYSLDANKILLKLKDETINLGEIYHGYNGINPGNQKSKVVVDKKINEKYKKVIDGKNIKRYSIKWGGKWILYDKDILERARDESIFLTKSKIMLQKIGVGLVGSLDTEQLYALINTTILLKEKGEYNEKFILALINSKLLNYFYKEEFLGVQIKTEFLEKIPIPKINFSNKKEKAKHNELVKLADKMLSLNKNLQKLNSIMDDKEYNELKDEIEKTDREIDERVYELYGLNEDDIKVVE